MRDNYDVVVIGSGPAGLAAASSASDAGARVCLIEREERLGGILKQCIHDGFGLIRFGEQLTGPEYAWRYIEMVRERPIDVLNSTFLTEIHSTEKVQADEPLKNPGGRAADGGYRLTLVNKDGVSDVKAKCLVMAMGCRERTDRQVFIQGERPAGIFTAGQAQDLINLKGGLPSRRCVILGSGDIGLIMARRLTLEGAEVLGVYEIGPEPSGLNRNVAQCLEDYGIPLHLRKTVSRVEGRQRVEGVWICPVDEGNQLLLDQEEYIPCDALILSVGLIPENDMLTPLGIEMDPVTRGPRVDQYGETRERGIFSCGNALHVNDLVDYVSQSGHAAGRRAAERALGNNGLARAEAASMAKSDLALTHDEHLAYTVPQRVTLKATGAANTTFPLYFRVRKSRPKGTIQLWQGKNLITEKRLMWLKPSEMEKLEITPEMLISGGGDLRLELKLPSQGREK